VKRVVVLVQCQQHCGFLIVLVTVKTLPVLWSAGKRTSTLKLKKNTTAER
jgi:hypothetical protein